jgi:HSP20 family protein
MTDRELAPKEKQELKEQEQTRPGRYYVPEVEIFEDEQALYLSADMPGVDFESVEVELNDDVLTLQGRVSLSAYEGLRPLYTEYNVGHYLRRFTLSDGSRFDRDAITARVVNGVLDIRLPRSEKTKPRRISVTAP